MGNWPPSRSIVVGTLLGGAVGDAMGAPFEGLWSDDIPSPEPLLSSFHEYHGYPSGQYTDDTQLTIATIRSIVENGDVVIPDIARSIAELWRHHSVIGPGGACTQAAERYLATGDHHDMGAPVGQAGNGTAMRTAALGLWFGADRDSLVSAVADVSRLTHQDPRSVAGGVAIALAANLLASEPTIDAADLCDALASAISDINAELSDLIRALPNRMRSPDCRQFIAAAGQPSAEFSAPIISPFVIPTVARCARLRPPVPGLVGRCGHGCRAARRRCRHARCHCGSAGGSDPRRSGDSSKSAIWRAGLGIDSGTGGPVPPPD